MGTPALEDLQALLGSLHAILRRVASSELSEVAAVKRLETLLGPPVRTGSSKGEDRHPLARTCDELVNGCRLALDRVRAGMMSEADGLEAIHELVRATRYEETQADVHDLTLEPLDRPPPAGRNSPLNS